MGAVKRAAGKKSKKAAGKANALAMGGVGIFAPKVLSPALATICGGKKMARTEVTKKIWAYIKKNSLNQGRTIKPDSTRRPSSRWRASTCSRWPATSASTCREPLGEPRRFSRRVPTSRRALESQPHEFDSCLLTSATLLELSPGYPCMLFGAAARPARRDAATTATVVAVFKILIFRNFKRFEDVNRGTVWPKKRKKK